MKNNLSLELTTDARYMRGLEAGKQLIRDATPFIHKAIRESVSDAELTRKYVAEGRAIIADIEPCTLATFQEHVRKTKIWKGRQQPVIYAALGVAGESGELVDKVKKAMRGDDNIEPELTWLDHVKKFFGRYREPSLVEVMNPARREAIILEMGDVLWYVVALADDLDVAFEDVLRGNVKKLRSRHARGKLMGDGDNR